MLKISFQPQSKSKSPLKTTARIYRRGGKPRYAGSIDYDPTQPFPAQDGLLALTGGKPKKDKRKGPKLFFIMLRGGKYKAKQ